METKGRKELESAILEWSDSIDEKLRTQGYSPETEKQNATRS